MFAFGGFQASSFQSFRERRAGTETESGMEETEEEVRAEWRHVDIKRGKRKIS